MTQLISDCKVTEKIYESARTLVFRATRQSDQLAVILKVLKKKYPTTDELERYHWEHLIIRQLSFDGVIKTYGLKPYEHSLVLLLEDFGGQSLESLYENQSVPVSEFLPIAIQAVKILGQIHTAQVIHKDINLNNIIFNQQSGELKVIDFDIASRLSREVKGFESIHSLEGTLAYISPEQTGRINRNIDYRSDYYSLGVSFYRLLTGRVPFKDGDTLEAIYAHIAKQPPDPREFQQQLPPALAKIVLKLLAKNAEDRYQSTHGLRADLEKAQAQFKSSTIVDFALAEKDSQGRFQLPQKLYGREAEINQLLQSFKRASDGSKVLLLIKGHAGIGKSALIKEIYKPITEKKGYFIEGKFEQMQRNMPYQALGKALNQWCRYVLMEGPDSVERWKQQLQNSLGDNARVITELVPDLALILDHQPAIAELRGDEAQNRLSYSFAQFFSVISNADRTLCLFLDDLQWADAASLRLLELIATSSDISRVLVIGAYRDGEVDASHVLSSILTNIEKQQEVVEISLSRLSQESVALLIAESLDTAENKVQPLANLVYRKTEGNPFFVREFLQYLDEKHWLRFDDKSSAWVWSTSKLAQAQVSSNVVDLLLDRIKKLDTLCQDVLMYGACLGNVFKLQDLLSLRLVAVDDMTTIQRTCVILANSGFIDQVAKDRQYRFVHDRVQQAAYKLLPDESKAHTHRLIGESLMNTTSEQDKEERLFEILDHFNKAANLFINEPERIELARLNFEAGRRARSSIAHQEAIAYFKQGISLLPNETWLKAYQLSLALYNAALETSLMLADAKNGERYFKQILHNAHDILDTVDAHELKLRSYNRQQEHAAAIALGLEFLKKLGLVLPKYPNALHVFIGFLKIQFLLKGKNIQSILKQPKMTNASASSVLDILSTLVIPSFARQRLLLPLIAFVYIEYSLRYGIYSRAGTGYAYYGIFLGSRQRFEEANEVGQLLFGLIDKFEKEPRGAKEYFIGNNLPDKKHHLKESVTMLKRSLQNTLKEGGFGFVGYIIKKICYRQFLIGTSFSDLRREMDELAKLSLRLKQAHTTLSIQLLQQTLHSLELSPSPNMLKGEFFDEEHIFRSPEHAENSSILFWIFFFKLIVCYIFKEYKLAEINIEKSKIHAQSYYSPDFEIYHFFAALNQLALLNNFATKREKQSLKKAKKLLLRMKRLAHYSPINYQSKYDLLAAEFSRVLGKEAEAAKLYQQAVSGSKKNQFPHEEAIANERAGEFYLEHGAEKLGLFYLRQSHYLYARWGAKAKAEQLETLYPELLEEAEERQDAGLTGQAAATTESISIKNTNRHLDFISLIKGTQILSREVRIEPLVSKLMQIVMEHTGAQNAVLLLNKSGYWYVEAVRTLDEYQMQLLQSKRLADIANSEVPRTVINYITKIHEIVVLDNASEAGDFTQDPYFKQYKTKSLLGLPIISQGKLIGILLLQHFTASHVFTPERTEVIEMMIMQMAISLENAGLYENLEHLVEERTKELSSTLVDLQQTQSQLVQARDAAESANQAKSKFLSNMSHELRTPLNAILGFSNLMLREDNPDASTQLGPTHREHLALICRSGEHLLKLINNVLDLSKIEAGKTVLSPSEFDLRQLLDDVVELFSFTAKEKGLNLSLECSTELPQRVRTDMIKLKQVLLNLVSNALKFTRQGSVVIRATRCASRNASDTESPCLRFEVEDSGQGIATEELSELFNAFVQTESGRNTQTGTGLGLAISREFVELLGGKLAAHSELNQGTVFTFDIAVEIAPDFGDRFELSAGHVATLKPDHRRSRILIVDDDASSRELLSALLEPLGFQIKQACDGQQGLALFEQWQPHLILTDLRMPIMDGHTMSTEVRARATGQEAKIIALSASLLDQEREQAITAGCDAFLSKPFKQEDIFALLHKYLGAEYVQTASEKKINTEEVAQALSSEALRALPDSMLKQLEHLALVGNVTELGRLIEDIGNDDEVLAQALKHLSNQFQYSKIVNSIREIKVE